MADQKKHEKILSPDGKFMYILTKAGQIIILNLVWLLTCIPIFTIGTAITSLYYAMMKNIRRNRSYPLVEYFASFKRTFVRGSIFTVVSGIWLLLLYHLQTIAVTVQGENGIFLNKLYVALMVVTAAILIYLFPVLSRFTMSMTDMVKLAFVMAVRFIGYTILILAGTALLFWLSFFYLPIPVILFLPGTWCYVCTFMIEKALRKYMPASDGNEDAWYYE
ncbi:MAG: DUF624 domain-containing protein [Lachnospiraceae bacterium]|nr:DUF624 domain-containing protein [Lachnospiraceae bacterium]